MEMVYTFEAGGVEVLQHRTVMEIDIRDQVLGGATIQLPAVLTTTKVVVGEVMPDGSAMVMSQFLDTSINGKVLLDGEEDDDLVDEVVAFSDGVAAVQGVRVFGVYDRLGKYTAGQIQFPDGASQEQLANMERVHRTSECPATLPAGDAHVGLSWDSETKVDLGGMRLTTRITNTVSSIQGDIVRIDLAGVLVGIEGVFSPTIELQDVRGTVSGHKVVNLRRVSPVEVSTRTSISGVDGDGMWFDITVSSTGNLAGQA